VGTFSKVEVDQVLVGDACLLGEFLEVLATTTVFE
jgi:hypothetical protein